jgi:hypothetical protein
LQLIRVGEIRPPSARGPGGVELIASSTCTARLVNQADGLSSSLPRRHHLLRPARLCNHHQPGPRQRGGTTLTAYRPAGMATAVRTLRPTPTSPPPPHASPSCRRRRLSLLPPHQRRPLAAPRRHPGRPAGPPLPPAEVKKEGDDALPLSLSSCHITPMPDKTKSGLSVLIGITKAPQLSAAMINYPTNHGGGMRGVMGCKGVDGS